jgi:hypothetical protein
MILLYIFLIGCSITGIVALGVIFALAAAGFGELPGEAESLSADIGTSAEQGELRATARPHEQPD